MSKYPEALDDSACPDVQVHEQDEHQCHARVALQFVDGGDIDYRTFQTIVYRTALIEDEQKMAVADRRVKV